MKTISSILAETAVRIPDKPLFVFPETRKRPAEQLTYCQLAERSAAAAEVIARQAVPGRCALLMLPTGSAFWESFFGCLLAGVIAVPLNTPNLNRSSDLLASVCRDCDPAVLITDRVTAELLRRRADRNTEIAGLPLLDPEEWAAETSSALSASSGTPDRSRSNGIAFLQYTSGSTARPRGIPISHGNLIANLSMIRDRMQIRQQDDRGVTWLPHYHDMGLVGSYLTTLFTGNTSWCLPPEEFVLQPLRWLQLISSQQANVCGAPDFAYRLCAEKISDQQSASLDLSSWRVAYIGAERIRHTTLQLFAEKFRPQGFRSSSFFPCYGLGEATLLATGGPADSSPVLRQVSAAALMQNQIQPPESSQDTTCLVSSGQTFAGSDAAIVNPLTAQVLNDELVGEICLSGPAVAHGYYHRPDLNEGLFHEVTINGMPRRFLRTGDLGFLSQGNLFITGRTKELIIIRGRNLNPEDIEDCLTEVHPALQPGAMVAFSIESDGQEALIVAGELKRNAMAPQSPQDIFAAIRQRIVAGFGVNPLEILLLRPAAIPRTSSGKLKRLAVRDSFQNNSIECTFRESNEHSK